MKNKKDYYKLRNFNDEKRLKSYKLEKKFILKHCKIKNLDKLNILDFGSGTGEMLDEFNVNKNKIICIENAPYAIKILKMKNYKVNSLNKILNSKKIMFDLIIFRGSIQYLKNPYFVLEKLKHKLKKNSYLIFLQTPNSSSLSFKFNKILSFLEFGKMFYIPNENSLVYFMSQINLKKIKFEYPYITSPYKNIVNDFFCFILNIFGIKYLKYSFPGNIFNAIFRKEQKLIIKF